MMGNQMIDQEQNKMAEIYDVLVSMRNSFSLLWDDFGFALTELKPRGDYHDMGYEACFENEWCKLVFMSESGLLDEIYVRTKKLPYFGWGLKNFLKLLTGIDLENNNLVNATAKEFFDVIAEHIRPVFPEMLELAKTPDLFKARIKELEAADHTEPVTIEMIRAERARLHSLGLDSSLGTAMANLRKGAKHDGKIK